MKRIKILKVRCALLSVVAGIFIFAGFFIMCILDTDWINISLWGGIMLTSFVIGALFARWAYSIDKTIKWLEKIQKTTRNGLAA